MPATRDLNRKSTPALVLKIPSPAPRFEAVLASPPPDEVESMVIVLVVEDRLIFEPATRDLNRKSAPDLLLKIPSPDPRLEAVLVSPPPKPDPATVSVLLR